MRLIAQNEDFSTNEFEVCEKNCKREEFYGLSGLVEGESKFERARQILIAFDSNARVILYDTSHKYLEKKLRDELGIQPLSKGNKDNPFSHIPYDFMLFTSGTTGAPSGVFKSKSDLCSEVEVLREMFAPCGIKKVVATVPFVHIYGILTLILAKEMDVDLWLRERFLPSDLANLVEKGTLVATTPLYINALLQSKEDYDFSGSVFVSSTAPLSQTSAEEFCTRFKTKVVQLYGSTESGGIAYKEDGQRLWRPLKGVSCSQNSENCLRVKSPWVSEYSYEGEFKQLNKVVDTFDEVAIYEEGFEIIGRKGNIIKLGGKRYSTVQIENIIEKDERVKCSLVEIIKKEDKNSLKDEGLLVYIEGEMPQISELKKMIKEDLGVVNFPIKIVMVKEISKSSIGKKIRENLHIV